jgi:hypothetical protein
MLLPPTVAVTPTLPATVLVSVITAFPLASVVTVALPTIAPAPLAIANVTDWLATGFPFASVMCACTLFVEFPFAVAPVVTTLKAVVGDDVLAAPATNTTVAGLPLSMFAPFTVAVIPTLPATVLVNVMIALPLASVVTVPLPTIAPVPLATANVTDWLATGFPFASVMCACTLFVELPFAVAPVVTTLKAVVGDDVLAAPATNTTVAGLPLGMLAPMTVAVSPTLPATVLVSVITAFPFASVVTVALPTIAPVPLAIANVTDWLATGFPFASVMCACTLFVELPFAVAPVVTTLKVDTNGSGKPGTKVTNAGLPKIIDCPATFAVIVTTPANVLVSVITALPLASVLATVLTPPAPPLITNDTS